MNQKTIRQHSGASFTVDEAAAWLKELDDRTKSSQTGCNSVDELATKLKSSPSSVLEGDLLLTGNSVQDTLSLSLPYSRASYIVTLRSDDTGGGIVGGVYFVTVLGTNIKVAVNTILQTRYSGNNLEITSSHTDTGNISMAWQNTTVAKVDFTIIDKTTTPVKVYYKVMKLN